MSVYREKPWLELYDDGMPAEIEAEFGNALDLFRTTAESAPDRTLLRYFDSALTVAEVDRASDALAVALLERGVGRGDRVALYLQNVPQFPIAMLAAWKLGAIAVPVNPMLKERELEFVLGDSDAAALVTLESLYRDVAAEVVPDTDVRAVVTTSELDFLDEIPALLAGVERKEGADDLVSLVRAHGGARPEPVELAADDVAFLTYTSGTTGPPKGAMLTHANVAFNAQSYREWVHLTPEDGVLALAPLFHVTGLIAHLAVGLLVPMSIQLAYRFDPEVTLDLVERYRPTFTVASITVFIALMNHPAAIGRDLSSLTKVLSGGAPIAPATVEAWEERFGAYIRNIYGLTETTSPSHGIPMGRRAPVDPRSGSLAIGVPIFNTRARILGDDGSELPPGEVGELAVSGPQVVAGYWQKPEETEHALGGGELKTGDVCFMDEEGWFYLVDRKKDQINVAGYKVWPREVEDVLYQHPAVREVAVVGVPDAYRGETVKAFVSLKAGEAADRDELIAFCKERIAAYKYPRDVEIMEDLPKTVTGKILRRELRLRETTKEEA